MTDSETDKSSKEFLNYITQQSKLGYQCIKEGKYKEAEEYFRDIISKDQDNNYALVGLGDALRRQRLDKEAIELYRHCLELYPENNYALFGIAESYRALKYYPKAIEAWEKYAKIDESNITVMTRMADIYRKMKNLKRSKEVYEQVLKTEESNVYAIIGLAHVYYDQRLYRTSLNYWEQILNRSNARVDIRVLTSVGNCYRKLREFSKALEYFQRAEEIDPKNFYVLYGMADSYRGLANLKQAMDYWNTIMKEGYTNQFVLTRAGDTAAASGLESEARKFYSQALSLGSDLYATLGLAALEHKQSNFSAAISLLEGILEEHYRNPRLQLALAMNYCAINQASTAYESLDSFIEQGYGNEEIIAMRQNLKESLEHSYD